MAEALQRWKWTVAYDGATYEGWQSQPSGNTIQDVLEHALAEMNGMPTETRVHGSGRTDAGVHADGQVCHVDTPMRLHLDAQSWPRAMNARLPASIRILEAEPVSDAFHARFSVISKTYRYQIFLGNILPPMLAERAWQIHNPLDRNVLLQAANILEGTHDFRAFAANRGPNCPLPRSTVRTIKRIEVTETTNNQWFMEFTADGFLYRMVRMLVGTMIQFAHGKLSESRLKELVSAPRLLKTSACAPAKGLYLSKVFYLDKGIPR
ncbi:MAG: tRNA pseudouridine(38-40) synthase TruA [Verrucomicrobiaceae bacterium]|nr:tRNA pseudouridine(38-40) synthase TruA [Verrucomicrobiaceae bacterium]